jgi:hypothetical protein
MTTTDHTWTAEQWDQHQIAGVQSTIRSLLDVCPSTDWSLEESMILRAALHEIALGGSAAFVGSSSRRTLPSSLPGTG